MGKFLLKLLWAEKIAEGMTREGGRKGRKNGRGREEIHRCILKCHGIMDDFLLVCFLIFKIINMHCFYNKKEGIVCL